MRAVSILLASAALAAPAHAAPAPLPADPLGSPMWEHHAKRLFGAAPVVFDDRVKVILPELAETSTTSP
jgi:sulfur-oxidizing protein SoxY